MHYWPYGGHMVWMAIFWLPVFGLFSLLMWLIVPAVNGGPRSGDRPEELLRQRYAAGEIDNEEFKRRLEELQKTKSAA